MSLSRSPNGETYLKLQIVAAFACVKPAAVLGVRIGHGLIASVRTTAASRARAVAAAAVAGHLSGQQVVLVGREHRRQICKLLVKVLGVLGALLFG